MDTNYTRHFTSEASMKHWLEILILVGLIVELTGPAAACGGGRTPAPAAPPPAEGMPLEPQRRSRQRGNQNSRNSPNRSGRTTRRPERRNTGLERQGNERYRQ